MMGRWDIYWGPAHILIHPWDGWMSGRGGGGPLVVRISNRQDGGGNELLPGAGGETHLLPKILPHNDNKQTTFLLPATVHQQMYYDRGILHDMST